MIKRFLPYILLLFIWVSKDFHYMSDAINFMNSLPEAQREKAYIVPLSTARAGIMNGYYTVIYPNS